MPETTPASAFFHTENRGLSAARNLGIRAAMETDSDYLVFADSDDWLEDDMVERLVSAVLAKNADVVVCGEYLERSDRTRQFRYGDRLYTGPDAAKALTLGKMSSRMMNKIWRKECFETVRFPEGRVFEDVSVMYRIFYGCETVATVRDILYHYREREGSIARTCSIRNRYDCWLAVKERCDFFLACAPDDLLLTETCRQQCVRAAAKLWHACHAAPREERERYAAQLKEVSAYIRKNVPLFGRRNWRAGGRILSVPTRSASPLSFGFVSALYALRPEKK
ncbi:MAG: glycosyltransferase [Lachnospiraceae bacterium]|nr:glycosyltransferase [Lachnospiraceae bacterium]